jgi:recombination protein RecT
MGELQVIEKQLTAYRDEFASVLPANLPVDRLVRTVMISLEGNPTLAKANPMSILRSAMSAAVLGLEVDGVSGQGYLVPYRGQSQFLAGYKGLVSIAARSARTLEGHVIYDGDQFDFDEGAGTIHHKWGLNAVRDRVIGAYARSRSHAYPEQVVVMGLAEIIAVRDSSAGYRGRPDASPWTTHFAAMARKTPQRRLAKDLPVLPLHLACALETQHDLGHVANLDKAGGVVVQRSDGAVEVLEGELLDQVGPTDTLRIAWPNNTESEPLTRARYVSLMARAIVKATPEIAEQLWGRNKATIERLPDKDRSTLIDHFAAKGAL